MDCSCPISSFTVTVTDSILLLGVNSKYAVVLALVSVPYTFPCLLNSSVPYHLNPESVTGIFLVPKKATIAFLPISTFAFSYEICPSTLEPNALLPKTTGLWNTILCVILLPA